MSSTGIKVYITSVSGSREVKNRVVKIQNTLTSMRIDYEEVDVALDAKYLEDMRAKMNDHKAVVPQFFKDDQYLGDYEAFHNALEDSNLLEFFQLSKD